MKRAITHILVLFLLGGSTQLLGQTIDIGISPYAALFAKNVKGGVEVGVGNNLGFALDGLYSKEPIILPNQYGLGKLFSFRLGGKFYLKPNQGLDGFYISSYLKYRQTLALVKFKRASIGFMVGAKLFANERWHFEFAAGVGQRFYSNFSQYPIIDFIESNLQILLWDFATKLTIGYRIQKPEKRIYYRP